MDVYGVRETKYKKKDTMMIAETPYYRGFIEGCISVEGNTMEACELATDS